MTTGLGRRSWFALATLILIPGCLEFKKQTLILKFDDKSDKITILSVCEGFYVGGGRLDKKEALKDAKDSLAEFVGEEPAFRYLAGWIAVSVKPMPDDSAEVAANKRRMAPIVEIGRGKLFLNEDGRLSGTQMVTIKDRKAFETALNELYSQQVAKTKSTPEVSAESLDLMHKAAAEGHKWVTITPGRFLFDLPMTGKDADKVLAKVMGEKKNAVALAVGRRVGQRNPAVHQRRDAVVRVVHGLVHAREAGEQGGDAMRLDRQDMARPDPCRSERVPDHCRNG